MYYIVVFYIGNKELSMTSVLIGQKQQDEIQELQSDKTLKKMFQDILVSGQLDIERIHYRTVTEEYKNRGGQHQPLRIGSLKDALKEMMMRARVK